MFPLFSESRLYDAFCNLFSPVGFPFLVAITAILVWGIMGIVKLFIRHQERMAMIERGIHPDIKEEEPPTSEDSHARPPKN
jgi:hypothetical protein